MLDLQGSTKNINIDVVFSVMRWGVVLFGLALAFAFAYSIGIYVLNKDLTVENANLLVKNGSIIAQNSDLNITGNIFNPSGILTLYDAQVDQNLFVSNKICLQGNCIAKWTEASIGPIGKGRALFLSDKNFVDIDSSTAGTWMNLLSVEAPAGKAVVVKDITLKLLANTSAGDTCHARVTVTYPDGSSITSEYRIRDSSELIELSNDPSFAIESEFGGGDLVGVLKGVTVDVMCTDIGDISGVLAVAGVEVDESYG